MGQTASASQVADGVDLKGKVALITGCNTGIGKETARVFAAQGATVFLACRSLDKAQSTMQEIKDAHSGADVRALQCDLSSLDSVCSAAEDFLKQSSKLDILVNNAGVMMIPEYTETKDGFEMQWGTNHLGHFLLTNKLLPALQQTPGSRIVNVSSMAHQMSPPFSADVVPPKPSSYSGTSNYGLSKLCNILFSRELNRRFGSTGITSFALHPGVIPTDLGRYSNMASFFYKVGGLFMKTIPQGAATQVFCALRADPKDCMSWFMDCATSSKFTQDSQSDSHAALLWSISEQAAQKWMTK